MDYTIIMDSCGDIPDELKDDKHIVSVPLTLDLGKKSVLDNGTCSQHEILKAMKSSDTVCKSACPSPMSFIDKITDAARTYMITLSSKLSGSFNSAKLAVSMKEENHGDIHVIDSKSASVGETLIALKIEELESENASFDEITKIVSDYVDNMHTYFVLESLDTLKKAGRLSGVESVMANTLNIKPIMGSTDEGSIQKIGQQHGINKALMKMVDKVVAEVKESESKILGIAHCNCPDRAEFVKSLFEAKCKFKNIIIVGTAGVSTLYANDGGIIVAV